MTTNTVRVDLEAVCGFAGCAELAWRFNRQLGKPRYSRGASVLPMPDSIEAWRSQHRTARKRADRSVRLGYRFAEIDRSHYNDDIHAINTSLDERQGRPMSEGYVQRHDHGPLPSYGCDRHRIHTYGVLDVRGTLVAYLTLYRCGALGLVSMILGHGDHLRNDIMFLLFAGMIADQARHGGFLFYNRHDSGTDGLRWHKERIGFAPADIEWTL